MNYDLKQYFNVILTNIVSVVNQAHTENISRVLFQMEYAILFFLDFQLTNEHSHTISTTMCVAAVKNNYVGNHEARLPSDTGVAYNSFPLHTACCICI